MPLPGQGPREDRLATSSFFCSPRARVALVGGHPTPSGRTSRRLQVVAQSKRPRSLLEVNTLLAAATFLTPEQVEARKKLPILDQARVMVKAMPKATRVGEFVAMWTIAKNRDGATSVEAVAEMWDDPFGLCIGGLRSSVRCGLPPGTTRPINWPTF